MGQDGSKIASKRRVEDGEKVQLLGKENRATVKLSASEIKTLKQLYHRLASLSPENEFIDKQTFLNYFPLEGILAERLFATFDKDKNNVIDYEEFLGGLALCLSGTVDEKFQLVFDLYNIDDGDGISEEELAIVLKSTFMAATAIVNPAVTYNLVGDHNKSVNINEHVHNVVKDAFEQCDTSQTGKLSPEEFRTWAEHHSYILDIIFGHKSFTDKQQISENITAATMKAVEMNSLRYQAQTWVDSSTNFELPEEISRGYSKATYLWSPVFPVMLKAPKSRSEHTVCVYQGVLYLLGGRGTTAYKDFWKYDLVLNNWSEIVNNGERPSLIFGHTTVVHKGSMYVYGGEFKSCETLVWKYTFDSNIWQRISPTSKKSIPGNRRHHTAVIYDNKMYVFGGIIDIRGCTNELWSFNFVNHDWELIIQTPKNNPGSRYEHSALVYNKIMWITGGLANYQSKSDVWKWNFESFSWTKIKTRGGPFPIYGHRVVRCGNAMVVFGGSINGVYDNMIWKFDFENQNWSVITPHGNVSPSARSAPAVVTLSAFSLPLLPPQMIKQNSNHLHLDEELRPHSTPDFKSKQSSVLPRHWSLSTDSLYQPPTNIDKYCSSSSTDHLDVNSVISFTNASYSNSIEGPQFPQCERNTVTLGEQDKTIYPKPISQWNIEMCSTSDNTELKRLLPNPKEGLCLFLVGGKCCGNHDFYTKGVDIWRCDVTKRCKRSNKVTKINVKTAGTATWSGVNSKSEQFIPKEQLPSGSKSSFPADQSKNTSSSNSPAEQSRKTCRQDVFQTCESTEEASTCYGDVVVTDLVCSNDLLQDK